MLFIPEINLPPCELKIKKTGEKYFIFDRIRKKYFRLTPEEYIRQYFINYLILYKQFPEALLANEITIHTGIVKRRCDTILYDIFHQPLMVIEYKAAEVEINQNVFDQIVRYNMVLNVPWLVVSNGLRHYCCQIDYTNNSYSFLPDIPDYPVLKK